ncbi:MAG: TetR/AcrR family transcriptional regulator, partial [Solirubrobacteraceae bacterium]|nr:TetR/AcrR family transcriptional regulator [Solirubrobacteraceae bacterium]
RAAIDAGDVPEQNAELTAGALVGAANEVLAGPLALARMPAGEHPGDVVGALVDLWRRSLGT